jgi:hypothetical protein
VRNAQEPDFQEEEDEHAAGEPARACADGAPAAGGAAPGDGASLADVKSARAELELGAFSRTSVFAFVLPVSKLCLGCKRRCQLLLAPHESAMLLQCWPIIPERLRAELQQHCACRGFRRRDGVGKRR